MSPRRDETPEQFAGRLARRENLIADLYFWIAWTSKVLLVVAGVMVAWHSWRGRR